MPETDLVSILRKGKKIILTWIEKNFNLKLFGTSDLECLESPLFETEESTFKISLLPCYKGSPGRVTCLLTKVDTNTLKSAEYFIDCEIAIDKKIWKLPETRFCFGETGAKFVPLMKLVDLKSEEKFPPECEMTVKFGLRRCVFMRSCSRYASVMSELIVINGTRETIFQEEDSNYHHESSDEDSPSDEAAANYASLKRDSHLLLSITRFKPADRIRANFFNQKRDILLKCKINLIDTRKNIVIASKDEEALVSAEENFFVHLDLPESYLQDDENSSSPYEPLAIHKYFSINYGKFIGSIQLEHDFSTYKKKCCSLKSDLTNVNFNIRTTPDFCIKAGENTIAIHKGILAARSPVFKAMLMNDMVESRTGFLEITDINFEVLRALLRYIYSSEFQKNFGHQDTVSLYTAADQYGILRLLSICRRELTKNVTVANFDDLLILSHLHRDNEIKHFISSFLSTWYFDSEAFSRLDKIMNFDRPITEVDMEFIDWMKNQCSLMSINNGGCIEESPQLE